MRKTRCILSLLMIAVLMFTTFSVSVFAAGESISVTLKSDKQYAKAGDIVTVTVHIANNYNATNMRWPILYSNTVLELVGENGNFDTLSGITDIGGNSIINPATNDKFLPDGYSSAEYSALLVQWTGGVSEAGQAVVYNQSSGVDCYTLQFRIKEGASGTGNILIPQTPSSYTPFYNQAIADVTDPTTVYRIPDLAYSFTNASVTVGEEPAKDPELIKTEGSTTVIDKDRKFIYGLEEGYADIADFVTATNGGEIEVVPTDKGNGTGTKINLVCEGEILDTYTVVIFGDVNGDAWADEVDILMLNQFMSYVVDFSEDSAQYVALEVSGDGWVDEVDYINLCLYFTYSGTIDQTTGLFEKA